MSRPLFGYILAASLLFLALFLVRADGWAAPAVFTPGGLALALAFALAGFLLQAATWWATLAQSDFRVSYRMALASAGTAVFTRYIPGKVFAVLGRAVYVAERTGNATTPLGMVSLTAQLVALWSGLTIGAIGLAVGGIGARWIGALIAGWAVLTLLVFSDAAHRGIERLARSFGRRLTLPRISVLSVLKLIPWFTAMWLTWAVGLTVLMRALFGAEVPWIAGLAFPFATTIGIVAVFAPGGLGVREGALAAFLLALGMPSELGLATAIYARIWFLGGEGLMFVIGLVAGRSLRFALDD